MFQNSSSSTSNIEKDLEGTKLVNNHFVLQINVNRFRPSRTKDVDASLDPIMQIIGEVKTLLSDW